MWWPHASCISTKSHAQAEEVKTWDIGDIVGATGPVHKSGKGDLYVIDRKTQLLTKALRPLPDKWHGLSDTEMRYRQRYVDLIVNDDVKRVVSAHAPL
jgi:lysyl-tRNA synthetase class 2